MPRAPAAPAHLTQARYVSYEDAHITQPLLVLAFPAVPQLHPDELALDALAELLGNAPGSVFYRAFRERQQAAETQVSDNSHELAGEFELAVKAQPGASLRTTEAQVRAALAEFARRGVADEELARFKAKREMQELLDVESAAGKAVALVTYDYLSGNPNQLPGVIARLCALTPADVMRVFRQYVQQPAVVLSVVPPGAASLPRRPGPRCPPWPRATRPKPSTAASCLRPAPAVPTPALWRTTLANGVRVLGTQNTELPITQLRLTIAGATGCCRPGRRAWPPSRPRCWAKAPPATPAPKWPSRWPGWAAASASRVAATKPPSRSKPSLVIWMPRWHWCWKACYTPASPPKTLPA